MSLSGLSAAHCHTATNMALQAAVLGYHKRSHINYTEGSGRWDGIDHNRKAWRGEYPYYADCSAYVTWCLWNGLHHYGVRDVVNGAHWQGGFTGTMVHHGRTVHKLFPGCAVIYGPGESGTHTAIYTGGGLVVSHGNQAGPQLLRYNYRSDIKVYKSYIY